jgi:hypothetical protein
MHKVSYGQFLNPKLLILCLLAKLLLTGNNALAIQNPPDQSPIAAGEILYEITEGIFQTQTYYRAVDWDVLSNIDLEAPLKRQQLQAAFTIMGDNTKKLLPLLAELEKLPLKGNIYEIYERVIIENISMCDASDRYIQHYERTKNIDYKQFGLVIDHDRSYAKWYWALLNKIDSVLKTQEGYIPKEKRAWETALPVATSNLNSSGQKNPLEIAPPFSTNSLPEADTDTALTIFRKGPVEIQDAQIKEIKTSPGNFQPRVFFKMANIYNYRGEKDNALFWFLVGELRCSFNANLYKDTRPSEWVKRESNRSSYQIKEYAKENPDKLEKTLIQVLEWDKQHAHCYDPSWLSQGWEVPPKLKPKDQWADILKKTQSEFKETLKKSLQEVTVN